MHAVGMHEVKAGPILQPLALALPTGALEMRKAHRYNTVRMKVRAA